MQWLIDIKNVIINIDNWSVADILSLLSLLLIIVGGIFAYKQWTAANRIKRTEFINQIIEKLRFDADMVKTMLTIDYDHQWYDENFHNDNFTLEFEVDKVLSYLSYICYTYKMKNISKKEFKILRYELNRACSSPAVQGYLWNLYHFSKTQKTDCTFQYLIDYGIKNKIIDKKVFTNNQCGEYPKYLNF